MILCTRVISLTLILVIIAIPLSAQQPNRISSSPETEPAALKPFLNEDGSIHTGRFTVKLTQRSPWAETNQLRQHYRNAIADYPDYFIQDETINVYVPPGYDGSEPYGLLVYIDPRGHGAAPDNWLPILDKHKLIWAGADNIGNTRLPIHRIAISLDCAYDLPHDHYNISPDRVYVSGFSGGGRIASWLALGYPEAFNGMIAQGAIDYWQNLPVPDQPGMMWPQRFYRPPAGPNLVKVLRRNRHVVVIGTEDPNHQQAVVTAEKMRQQRIAHVLLIEMQGKPHVPAGPDELDRAIDFLDAPLKDSK